MKGAKFRGIRIGRGLGLGMSRHLTGMAEGRRPLRERPVQMGLSEGAWLRSEAFLGARGPGGAKVGGDRMLIPAARRGAEPGARGRGLALRLGRWRTRRERGSAP